MSKGPSRRGTGFVSLNAYLGLNQGAAQRMGDSIAAPVEQSGQRVAGNIQAAELNTLEAIKKNTMGMPPSSGLTSQQALEASGRTYDGPTGIEAGTFTDIAGRAASTQAQANALNSNTGRATLLGKQYGQTSWGGGQLDAALAGAGGAGGRLAGAAGAYGRLVQQLGGAQANTQRAAGAAQEATGKAASAYGAMVPGLQQQEAATAQAAQDRANQERQERTDAHNRSVNERRERRGRPEDQNSYYVP